MKIKHLLAFTLLIGMTLVSCSETKTESRFANWKERNEAFIDSIASVYQAEQKLDESARTLFRYEDQRNMGNYIYYKVRESGDQESDQPYITSQVSVFYRGMLIDEARIATLKEPYWITTLYKNLIIFDGNFTEADPRPNIDKPRTYEVSGLISGWIEILQHMHKGDRWEVYIPHQSAYGSSPSGVVRPYSTLIFDLTLEDIFKL